MVEDYRGDKNYAPNPQRPPFYDQRVGQGNYGGEYDSKPGSATVQDDQADWPVKRADQEPQPVRAVEIPSTFWQELLALLLQFFGQIPGARDQGHLMARLQTMHADLHRQHAIDENDEALRKQQEAMQPENRARFEAEEADRVAEEGRQRVTAKATDNRDRYGSPQVDNAPREAMVGQRHAEEAALANMSDSDRRQWNSLDPEERREALKNNQFASLRGRDLSEDAISRPQAPRG